MPHAYADKVAWVMRHLPELTSRVIITYDKGTARVLRASCSPLSTAITGRRHCIVYKLQARPETAQQEPRAKPELSDKLCAKCSSPMVKRGSSDNAFYGCSTYPKYKHTERA
jgi:hypothetical protein